MEQGCSKQLQPWRARCLVILQPWFGALHLQAGSPDPSRPANKLPEQTQGTERRGANPFHQPSDGNNPSQPTSLQAEREKAPDFVLNPPSYSSYPHSPALGRATFPYLVKKKWRISAIHSHIWAQPSLASMSL